jgi:hypothetical protein
LIISTVFFFVKSREHLGQDLQMSLSAGSVYCAHRRERNFFQNHPRNVCLSTLNDSTLVKGSEYALDIVCSPLGALKAERRKSMSDKWFYAWLRAKEICKESAPQTFSPTDEESRLFAYIASGNYKKASGRFDSFVEHIKLSRHCVEVYLKKLMDFGGGEWQFMAGFCTALELLECAAKKK